MRAINHQICGAAQWSMHTITIDADDDEPEEPLAALQD